MTQSTHDSGVSLLELVVAISIYSLVAVMSLQLLTSAMSTRTRIAAAEGDVPMMAASMAVLRRDLEQMQPVSGLTRAGVGTIPGGFEVSRDGSRLTLVIVSQSSTGLRVDWVLPPEGRLTRQTRPLDATQDPEAVVMARGILSWDVQVAEQGGKWSAVTAVPVSAVPAPPRGVRIDLQHKDLGRFRLGAAR